MNEDLVRRVVEEVLGKISSLPGLGQEKRVLLIVTGGSIGADQAFQQLGEVQKSYPGILRYDAVLSRSGSEIFPRGKLESFFRLEEVVVDDGKSRSKAMPLLGKADVVVAPVLTRNTAAKVAALFLDTLPCELIIDALMRGKPVIAVTDSADPRRPEFSKVGMGHGSPALVGAMLANLSRLAGWGIKLVEASELGRAVDACLRGEQPEGPGLYPSQGERPGYPQCGVAPPEGSRYIITRAEISGLVSPEGVVRVPRGAVITPLARDMVREAGFVIEEV